MDIRFLNSLITVAELGSTTAAARLQGLTPAAVRQRIKALEDSLGEALFRRAGRGIAPTEACLRILPDARRLVADADALSVRLADHRLAGVLRIGAIVSAMAGPVADGLDGLRHHAPDLQPEIHPGTSPQLYERVIKGDLDMAILIHPPFPIPKELAFQELRRDPLVFVGRGDMKGSIQEQLQQHPYIRYDPRSWGGMRAQAFVEEHGLNPDVFCSIDALEVIPGFVHRGLGVSLVPNWGTMHIEGLNVRLQAVDDPAYDRRIIALHRASPIRQRAIEAFTASITA